MKKAIYPGSFDPITMGHLDLIQRISPLYDEVVVVISENKNKNYLFKNSERVWMVQESLRHLNNVRVDLYQGLTINYARQVGAQVIVRGLRAVVDFEYEMAMANMNKKLAPDIETALIFASPDCYYISSRAIKEIAQFGGNLEGMVPSPAKELLLQKLNAKN